MTERMRILSFNWHEPYLCLMARTGDEFDVVLPEKPDGTLRLWDERMRPLPSNITLLRAEDARTKAAEGYYDLAVYQNVKDLFSVQSDLLPFIMVFHNRFSTEAGLGGNPAETEDYRRRVEELTAPGLRVFISESKKKDWGFEGMVILPGIDVAEYGGYTGEQAGALVVGNLVKERDLMMGYSDQVALLNGIPHALVGLNPTIPGSRQSKSWDDLKNHYRSLRFYLNTTVNRYEDGYNLAMLEAMATGMPVVSTFNETSPLTDGLNGFISKDHTYLRRQMERLLQDKAFAEEMGKQGQACVRELFPIDRFAERWKEAFQHARSLRKEQTPPPPAETTRTLSVYPKGDKTIRIETILMNYVCYPATTAWYMERAFRQEYQVITAGGSIDQSVIEQWNLHKMTKEIKPQDIPTDYTNSAADVMQRLPQGVQPDIYLWLETGIGTFPPDIRSVKIPTACYLVDTHLHYEKHLDTAFQFDFVFLAQKEYVESFRKEGIRCFWLPLGCDPEIHGKQEKEKLHDIGFVGSVTKKDSRRYKLLEALSEQFNVHIERAFHEEMAGIFSASRIVFNESVNNDLNMRVFEALCSGSFLLTDHPRNAGMEELFQDGVHLGIYEEDKLLVEKAQWYLEHPGEREKIAAKGREEVLNHHTYRHRAKKMTEIIEEELRSILNIKEK